MQSNLAGAAGRPDGCAHAPNNAPPHRTSRAERRGNCSIRLSRSMKAAGNKAGHLDSGHSSPQASATTSACVARGDATDGRWEGNRHAHLPKMGNDVRPRVPSSATCEARSRRLAEASETEVTSSRLARACEELHACRDSTRRGYGNKLVAMLGEKRASAPTHVRWPQRGGAGGGGKG